MFVFGLAAGASLGLAAGVLLAGVRVTERKWGVLTALLVAVFVLFFGFLNIELRLGIAAGMSVGFLLGLTPPTVPAGEEEEAS